MTYYQNKYQKLYDILKCSDDIFIPIGDLDAWNKYPKYRFAYNKLYISCFQNLECAPFPIIPKKYPIISKPIINLYGMGLNSCKIKNKKEFISNWGSNNFWCECLTGEHISYDIVLKNGKIKWHYCFRGYSFNKDKHGAFDYWESCWRPINKNIKRWLKKFSGYTGIVNIECIGENIIECHLRMGDIDHFAEECILKNIITLYEKKKWKLDKNFAPTKIFLFPVWWNDKNIIKKLKNKIIRKKIKNICNRVLCYLIDDIGSMDPPNMNRIMNLTASSYESGYTTRKMLYELFSNIL